MRPLVPLALLLLLAAQASAQVPPLPGAGASGATLQMELQDPGAALVPARPYALQLTVRYIYGQGGAAPTDQPCADLTVAEAPGFAEVNITPTRVCFTINPAQPFGTSVPNTTAIVGVNVTGNPLALEPAVIRIAGHAPAVGTLGEARGEVNRTVTTAYVGRLAVQAPPTAAVRGGSPQPLRVTLVNEGNGPMEVTFRNATAPPGVRVALPGRVVLQQPGEQRTVEVLLQVPWTAPVKGPVQLEAVGQHPSRPDLKGEPVRIQMDLDGKAAVPGAEPALLLLALASLARTRARRR